jgi:hypothetical protein
MANAIEQRVRSNAGLIAAKITGDIEKDGDADSPDE